MKQFLFGFLVALFALFGSNAEAQQTGPIYCNQTATVSATAAATSPFIPVVPAGSTVPSSTAPPSGGSARTYICSITIVAASTPPTSIALEYGTGATCTNPTVFTPSFAFAASAIYADGHDIFLGVVTAPGAAVCAVTTGTGTAVAQIYYAQQ